MVDEMIHKKWKAICWRTVVCICTEWVTIISKLWHCWIFFFFNSRIFREYDIFQLITIQLFFNILSILCLKYRAYFKYFVKIYLFNKTNDEILSFSQIWDNSRYEWFLEWSLKYTGKHYRTSNVYSLNNISEKCVSFDLSMKAFDVARFHSTIVSQIYLGTLVSQSLVRQQWFFSTVLENIYVYIHI